MSVIFLLTSLYKNVKITIEKGATVQQRFASLIVTNQKSNLLLWRAAVAFLMFMFTCGLYDTDYSNNDTNNRHHNTNNTDYYSKHLLFLSLYFPFVSPPKYNCWKFSKCTHFGKRRTANRFGSTHTLLYNKN